MPVSNCRVCGRVHRISSQVSELCSDCLKMQEAQYKVVLTQIDKMLKGHNGIALLNRIDMDAKRVNAYIKYRFGLTKHYPRLEGHLRGHCHICRTKLYYPAETACLDCLHLIQAMMEKNRLLQEHQATTLIAEDMLPTKIAFPDMKAAIRPQSSRQTRASFLPHRF